MSTYDLLPPRLRVIGSHGGFVGGGLATAVGLAIGEPRRTVVCTLGDQGFTNGVQSLFVMAQERAPVLCIVCNNGGSVSLRKQASQPDGGVQAHLGNGPDDYAAIVRSFGIQARRIEMLFDQGADAVAAACRELADQLAQLVLAGEPGVVELLLPSDPEAWEGIWSTAGLEAVR